MPQLKEPYFNPNQFKEKPLLKPSTPIGSPIRPPVGPLEVPLRGPQDYYINLSHNHNSQAIQSQNLAQKHFQGPFLAQQPFQLAQSNATSSIANPMDSSHLRSHLTGHKEKEPMSSRRLDYCSCNYCVLKSQAHVIPISTQSNVPMQYQSIEKFIGQGYGSQCFGN